MLMIDLTKTKINKFFLEESHAREWVRTELTRLEGLSHLSQFELGNNGYVVFREPAWDECLDDLDLEEPPKPVLMCLRAHVPARLILMDLAIELFLLNPRLGKLFLNEDKRQLLFKGYMDVARYGEEWDRKKIKIPRLLKSLFRKKMTRMRLGNVWLFFYYGEEIRIERPALREPWHLPLTFWVVSKIVPILFPILEKLEKLEKRACARVDPAA